MGLLQALNLAPPRAVTSAVAPLSKGPSPGATPVTLAIHKAGPFEPGSEHQLEVTAMMSDGSTQNYTAKVTWSTSKEALVKVLPGGLAKVGHGTDAVTIRAIAPGGKPVGTIDVQVQARLQDIVITPVNPLVEIGKTEPMKATGKFADGSTDNISHLVEWETDPPGAADFTAAGECTGKAAGTAKVVATHVEAKVSGFGKVTVFAAGKGPVLRAVAIEPLNPETKTGAPIEFKAKGTFADKSTHEITRTVEWRTSHPAVLRIDKTGLAKPTLQSGRSLITALDLATKHHQSTTAYVDFPGILRIVVTPKDVKVREDESVVVEAMATLKGGWQMRVDDLVQWTPEDPGVADFDPVRNVVEGFSSGESTTIEVRDPASGASDTISVTVLPHADD